MTDLKCCKTVNDYGFVPDLCGLKLGHEGPCKYIEPNAEETVTPKNEEKCGDVLLSGITCTRPLGHGGTHWSTKLNQEARWHRMDVAEPESVDVAPQVEPRWNRQESCSECDGDGCAKCEPDPQLSAQEAARELLEAVSNLEICCSRGTCGTLRSINKTLEAGRKLRAAMGGK